jgi:type IV pilus assembly protein PilC
LAAVWDKFLLKMPVLGPVISKVAISRFTRTLGTLVSSGVPILQALTIVRETSGNVDRCQRGDGRARKREGR